MGNSLRLAVPAGLCAALVVTGPVSAAAAEPEPRVVPLQPRVVSLQPRVVDITPKKKENTYTVDSDVLFAFGSATLSPDAKQVLDDVAAKLRADGAGKATVTGHTDSIGSTGSNKKLSTRRAQAVRDYLRTMAGSIAYTATGKGESDPVAANTKNGKDYPQGRKENRRVTVTYQKS